MSVSDPLLKEFKGNILKILGDAGNTKNNVSDTETKLPDFCKSIEKIFTKGFEHTYHGFGLTKVTYPWFWLNKILITKHVLLTSTYISAVEYVRKNQTVLTHLARLRLLIRCCLQTKSLHVPVEYLLRTRQSLTYYKESSILGNEILSEIFLSLLLQCAKINFKFDLTNSAFLSVSWLLPHIVRMEVVPCTTLGLSVKFVGEHVIIVNIQPSSVISESGKADVGDILYNINGIYICSSAKGKLSSILKSSKGQPVKLTIIKGKYLDTNEFYEPLIPLLKKCGLLRSNDKISEEKAVVLKKNASAGFRATYIGSVCVGMTGDVTQIDGAVQLLLSPFNIKKKCENSQCMVLRKPIYFEIGELGIKVVDSENNNVLLKHSFMEISSCGSISHIPHYFAYIAGNDYCNNATKFTCHVFYTTNSDFSYTILQSMGQGFERTHFVV